MNIIFRGFFLAALFLPLCDGIMTAQQNHVHMTENSKVFSANYHFPIEDIGNCVGGVFVATDSRDNTSYIVDVKGDIIGKGRLKTKVERLLSSPEVNIPSFYGGKVATAILANGHPAIINVKGGVVKEFPNGRDISAHFVDGLAFLVIKNNKGGERIVYINEDGDQVCANLSYSGDSFWRFNHWCVAPLSDGLRPVEFPGKGLIGFINAAGKTVIPAQYEAVHGFSDGLAAFKSKSEGLYGGYWGFIDTSGKEVIKPLFSEEPGDFHNGYAPVKKKNGKYVYIDKTANVVSEEYECATRFFNGFALVDTAPQQLKGVRDNYVINTKFEYVRPLPVSLGLLSLWYYMQTGGIKYDEKSNTFVINNVVCYPDGTVKLDVTETGKLRSDFIEDVALYECDDYYGLINSSGEVLLYISSNVF